MRPDRDGQVSFDVRALSGGLQAERGGAQQQQQHDAASYYHQFPLREEAQSLFDFRIRGANHGHVTATALSPSQLASRCSDPTHRSCIADRYDRRHSRLVCRLCDAYVSRQRQDAGIRQRIEELREIIATLERDRDG
jgi:hypothetical protein